MSTLVGQPNQFWQHRKQLNKPNSTINNLVSSDTWVEHFSSLNKQDPALITNNLDYCNKVEADVNNILLEKELLPPCPILDKPFTVNEVYAGINPQ